MQRGRSAPPMRKISAQTMMIIIFSYDNDEVDGYDDEVDGYDDEVDDDDDDDRTLTRRNVPTMAR